MRNIFKMSDDTHTAFKLALFQIFHWIPWAATAYTTVYLQENGFSASMIGIINAFASVMGIFSLICWGIISDKIGSVKKTLIITLSATAIIYSAIFLLPMAKSYSFILFLIYHTAMNFFSASCSIISEDFSLRSTFGTNVRYSSVRSLGSLSYSLSCILIMMMVSRTATKIIFPFFGITMIPAIIIALSIKDSPLSKPPREKKIKVDPRELFKNYYYVTFLVFIFIMYFALTAGSNFLAFFVADSSIDKNYYGLLCCIRAITEMPTLILLTRLNNLIKLKYALILSCVLFALSSFMLGLFGSTLFLVSVGMLFHGLGNGLFIGSTTSYIYKLAPNNLKASAQTVYGSVRSVSSILGYSIGGFVYDMIGPWAFYSGVGALFIISIIFFAISLLVKKNLPNPADAL